MNLSLYRQLVDDIRIELLTTHLHLFEGKSDNPYVDLDLKRLNRAAQVVLHHRLRTHQRRAARALLRATTQQLTLDWVEDLPLFMRQCPTDQAVTFSTKAEQPELFIAP